MEPESSSVLWIVIVGFIIAFILAFGIGANDVANSFGTSVGAKVLTLRQACIVAGVFEMAGAILLGSKVSDTVRKGIIDISIFNGIEKHAMVGALSALLGTSIWLIIATFFKLPVSGTHSVVGATIGYTLVATGAKGVYWSKFGMIAASWVISPLLSGIISSGIFITLRQFILIKSNPFKHGLRSIPLFYGITFAINVFSVLYNSSDMIGTDKLSVYALLGISLGAGIALSLVVHFAVAPWLKRRILSKEQTAIHSSVADSEHGEADANVPNLVITEESSEQNGCIPSKETENNIGHLRIPRMNLLLRKVLDPEQITISSSLSADSYESITINAVKVEPNTNTLPMNETEAEEAAEVASEDGEGAVASKSNLRLKPDFLLRNVVEPDAITVTSSLPSEDHEDTITSIDEDDVARSIKIPEEQRRVEELEEATLSSKETPAPIDVAVSISNDASSTVSVDGNTLCTEVNHRGRFHVTHNIEQRSVDGELRQHSSEPTTPVQEHPIEGANLLYRPRGTSTTSQSEERQRHNAEKEQARVFARSLVVDDPKTAELFKFLQIMTASFGAFAHGGNDVSNAIGPVISIWIIYNTGEIHSKASTPIWILLYGGVGIVIGLSIWGRRVIETIGENLTPVTPTSGFSIEIGAALTVLLASNLGIPISTTHCKVGSVVLTGRVRSRDVVDWSLFVNIVVSWVVTMPITGLISAGVYAAIVEIM